MANKLVERYQQLETELAAVRAAAPAHQPQLEARLSELKIRQQELKTTLLHLIALSSLRDEAVKALSYGA